MVSPNGHHPNGSTPSRNPSSTPGSSPNNSAGTEGADKPSDPGVEPQPGELASGSGSAAWLSPPEAGCPAVGAIVPPGHGTELVPHTCAPLRVAVGTVVEQRGIHLGEP